MKDKHPIENPDVAATFSSYADEVRPSLLALRSLILDAASETDGVGVVEETLKWGQPSYVTRDSGSGSTIRVAPTGSKSSHDYAMYFICNTKLVATFRRMFGATFAYDGNRAIEFRVGDDIAENELRQCIVMALTYHKAKV